MIGESENDALITSYSRHLLNCQQSTWVGITGFGLIPRGGARRQRAVVARWSNLFHR